MKFQAQFSDDSNAVLERDSRGYRIISSTNGWTHPPVGKVFYLESDPHQDGPIAVREYDADDEGNPIISTGRLVTSKRSIVRFDELPE